MTESEFGELPIKPGDIIDDKFRVDRVLGAGGMGVVVSAHHLGLDTLVAVKFMRPEAMAVADNVARFQREARAAVRMRGEHSARVLDVGQLKNGAPYMVMEFLTGSDLAVLVQREGPLPIPTAVHYVIEACEALAEAHSLGIVHRDIKPQNLFLTRRPDGEPSIKVVDFGLAKVADSGAGQLTQTVAIMGSPYYMSPEQLRASRDVDERTDIWSLGICLYELLTGRMPFEADSIAELCSLILTAPAPLTHVARADVPEALSKVIRRCLHKDPRDRYSSVAKLATALAEFDTDSRGVSARLEKILGARAPLPSNPDFTIEDTLAASQGIRPKRTDTTFDTDRPPSVEPTAPHRASRYLLGALAVLVVGAVSLVAVRAQQSPPPPSSALGVQSPAAPGPTSLSASSSAGLVEIKEPAIALPAPSVVTAADAGVVPASSASGRKAPPHAPVVQRPTPTAPAPTPPPTAPTPKPPDPGNAF